MKRFLAIVFCLLLVLAVFPVAMAGDTNLDSVVASPVLGDAAGFTVKNKTTGSSVWSVDGRGRMNSDFLPVPNIVYITQATQLSTWSGQSSTGGQSYFQTSPGYTYVVDFSALYRSTASSGVSAFKGVAFAGVSAILPDANIYGGPENDVTIVVGTTGSTGWDTNKTGSTLVWVWPYAGMAGLTSYGKNVSTYAKAYRAGNTPQTLHTYNMLNGTTPNAETVASGASWWQLSRDGESTVFRLQAGSQVSAFPKSVTFIH